MKRIYVCLLIFLCFAFVQAQKIKHPALLYTPERIQQVNGFDITLEDQVEEAKN